MSYKIVIYEDRQGKSPITEMLNDLNIKARSNKLHRVRLKKISEYIELLRVFGTRAGLPATKHIDGDIWELRPARGRIFFAYWKDNTFVLLHHYIKNTQKTPQKEIDQAKRNLHDFLERNE